MFRPLGGHRQDFNLHTINITTAYSFAMAIVRSSIWVVQCTGVKGCDPHRSQCTVLYISINL